MAGATALGFVVASVLVGTILLLGSGALFAPAPNSECKGSCIGSAFSVGNPTPGVCPESASFTGQGCVAGDFVYALTVESSTAALGSLDFEVVGSDRAPITVVGAGGFSVVPPSGLPSAFYEVPNGGSMEVAPGAWSYAPGIANSTSVSTLDIILIDMGTMNPSGQGYVFLGYVTGGESGPSILTLP